jgi:hypothetical protein
VRGAAGTTSFLTIRGCPGRRTSCSLSLVVAQFNEARLFLLEAAVTILCFLDVLLLVKGAK